jgi:hypothetical protein
MQQQGHRGAAISQRKKDEHDDPIICFGKFMVVGWLCWWIAVQRTSQFGSCAQWHFGSMRRTARTIQILSDTH